ncbi:hypothetical protein [Bacillus sp. 1P06AnD]|uniref:hypothetical protein n=1 Tax=Bacillus sp. 1P06AnD TaxID=3132208 RepID=UPI00399F0B6A
MLHSLKEALRLYTGQFERVAILSLTILLPLLAVDQFLFNIISFFVIDELTSFIADFYYMIVTLLTLVLAQVPFIALVKMEEGDRDYRIGAIYSAFILSAFSIFVFGVILSLFTAIASMFFVVPGLLLLLFFSRLPMNRCSRKNRSGNAFVHLLFLPARGSFLYFLSSSVSASWKSCLAGLACLPFIQ